MVTNNTTSNPNGKGEAKRKNYKFNEADYMITIQEEETKAQNAIDHGRVVEVRIPTGRVFDKKVLKLEYRSHRAKCIFRAAAKYDVSIDHIKSAYRILNGKKIDGIYVTDLLDRLGFSDGRQINTSVLATKYGHSTKKPVIVAEDKLKEVLNNADIKKAYADYMRDISIEVDKVLRNKAVYGE